MRHSLVIVCILALIASPAAAWSNKEHILLTRIAALRLLDDSQTPPEMKQWLRDAMPDLGDMESHKKFFLESRVGPFPRGVNGIAFWVTIPDMEASNDKPGSPNLQPFGVKERLLHFVDVEYFQPDENRRVFAHDLSNKPKLSDFPRDMKSWQWQRAGMLPFRVEQCYGELVKSIRAGRLNDKPGQFPRDDHAAKWAGYLAHYLEDNTQPQHSTVDYQSKSYFKGRAPNVHTDVEYRLVDDDKNDFPEQREQLWKDFVKALEGVKDPTTSDDLWEQTLEVSLHSYDALPLIGQAAAAAYADRDGDKRLDLDAATFSGFQGEVRGEKMTFSEMKARQLALAVHRVEKTWLRAWKEARQLPDSVPAAQ